MHRGPGDLVQYQLSVLPDKVVVDLHMESEGGEFFSPTKRRADSRFAKMIKSLKKRDQECGKALKSRTNLLRTLDTQLLAPREWLDEESQSVSAQRLLAYASRSVVDLRHFQPTSGPVNTILESLTMHTILTWNVRVNVGRILQEQRFTTREVEDGKWFIAEYDRHTISLIHYASVDGPSSNTSEGLSFNTRQVNFFTVSVSDVSFPRVVSAQV